MIQNAEKVEEVELSERSDDGKHEYFNYFADIYEACKNDNLKISHRSGTPFCLKLRIFKRFLPSKIILFVDHHWRFKLMMIHSMDERSLKSHVLSYVEMWCIVTSSLSSVVITVVEQIPDDDTTLTVWTIFVCALSLNKSYSPISSTW